MDEISINLRLKAELKPLLETLAKAQNRSVNNLINTILEDYLIGVVDKISDYLIESIRNLSDDEKRHIISKLGQNIQAKEKEDAENSYCS